MQDAKFHVFEENTLWLGGDVQRGECLQCLHTHGHQVTGSIPIAAGLWFGGNMEEAANLVQQGDADREDFKFFTGTVQVQFRELDSLILLV